MGPIIAFIWEVEILWWKRDSNLLVKKLELDFFFLKPPACVFINIIKMKELK